MLSRILAKCFGKNSPDIRLSRFFSADFQRWVHFRRIRRKVLESVIDWGLTDFRTMKLYRALIVWEHGNPFTLRDFSTTSHSKSVVVRSPVAPERIWKWAGGAHIRRKTSEIFVVVPLHVFGSKIQLVVFARAFVMVSSVLVTFLFDVFYSLCPRAQPFVKVKARDSVPYGVGATG